ncbi:intraflagellar transport protein 22 homolog [Rhodnius prolixus]|uniref:Putative rab-like protein 5 n=1 Tax=Rhodnius prolixus TaxID=13249 RepID=R4G4N4_RHOPR
MKKVKIILVGPLKCGKSTIANFLSEAIDYNIDNYRPTPGIRVLEYEINNDRNDIEIELWDCSGDEKYEQFWPVFSWNAQGVVLVFNPEVKEQLMELERMYENFVAKNMISNNNALIIANCKDPELKLPVPELSGPVASLSYVNSNVMENGDELRSAFQNFVFNIQTDVKDYELDDLSVLLS